MANTEVGSAFVSIYPDTSKFQSQIERGLNTSMLGGIGQNAGDAVGGGFQRALSVGKVAIGNLIAGMASTAMGAVVNHLDDAARRVDILNSFPKTMQALGYEADVAQGSIEEIMDHLLGLPTATQDMAQFVQALAAANGDLDLATKAGLAFNDMLLTSGANTADAANAQQMLTKMIGTNTYSSQRWASIMATMPGPMKELAEAMLGAGADGWALGEAIRDGTVSFEDMQRAMVELDQNGMDGLQSFEEQARAATGGIGTSFENLGNRINNALAKIMQAIGAENIVAPIEALSTTIVELGGEVASGIEKIKENVDFTPLMEGAAALGDALKGGLSDAIYNATNGFIAFCDWADRMADLIGPIDVEPLATSFENLVDALGDFAAKAGEGLEAIAPYIGGEMQDSIDHTSTSVNVLAIAFRALGDAINWSLQCWSKLLEGFAQFQEVFGAGGTVEQALIGEDVGLVYDGIGDSIERLATKTDFSSRSMKSSTKTAFNSIKNSSADVKSAMSDLASGTADSMDAAKKEFSGAVSSAKSMSSSIRSAINSAGGTVHVKLPIIKATTNSNSDGIKWPSFSIVGWKASGGVFNGPSVIGVAERGLEAAVPLEGRRMRPFAHAIAAEMGGAGTSNYQVNLNYDAGASVNDMARDIARSIKRYQLARG